MASHEGQKSIQLIVQATEYDMGLTVAQKTGFIISKTFWLTYCESKAINQKH